MSEEDLEFQKQYEQMLKMIAPIPECKPTYYLYYDTPTGNAFEFSMEYHQGSAYIHVTKEEYETLNINEIKVINGRVYKRELDAMNRVKYVRASAGTATLKDDIQFVVDDDYDGDVSNWKLNDGNH